MRVLGTECPFWKWLKKCWVRKKFKKQTKTQRNPSEIIKFQVQRKTPKIFLGEKKKGYLKEQKSIYHHILYQQVIIEKG